MYVKSTRTSAKREVQKERSSKRDVQKFRSAQRDDQALFFIIFVQKKIHLKLHLDINQ